MPGSNPSSDPRRVFRFAPSPNGYLHLGHAYSALVNDKLARECGGVLRLRIEDIDIGRSRKEFEDAIVEDLEWLGVAWEAPIRRQSTQSSDYLRVLEAWRERKLVYPCFCSRGDIQSVIGDTENWPRDPDGVLLYPGTCLHLSSADVERRLASGQSAALRLRLGEVTSLVDAPLGWREYFEGNEARDIAAEPSLWGDVVIGRRDVPGSYHLACVLDDAQLGVTDVVRGMDLFNATSLQRLLQEILDLPAPNYHHHKLVRDEAGEKLSKSVGAKSLRAMRAEGVSAQSVRRQLGFDEAFSGPM